MSGMEKSVDWIEATIRLAAVPHAGLSLDPDAIDRCPFCDSTYRRRNGLRHWTSRAHRRSMRRALGTRG